MGYSTFTVVGMLFNPKRKVCLEDFPDLQHCTWTDMQMDYDLRTYSIPAGLLVRGDDGKLYKTCETVGKFSTKLELKVIKDIKQIGKV